MLHRLALVFALSLLAPAASADAPEFTLTLETPQLREGAPGTLSLTFTPEAPWHWNSEYPAKLKFTPAPGVQVAKASLAALSGDLEAVGPAQRARFALTGEPAAGTTVLGQVAGKIGLCNDRTCITRKVELTVTAPR